jgi:hypothetical protein
MQLIKKFISKTCKHESFPRPYNIFCHSQHGFLKKVPKDDAVGKMPRCGYKMGDRHPLEVLQRPVYVGKTRNIIHAGVGLEAHLKELPNLKLMNTVRKRKKCSNTVGTPGIAVLVCSTGIRPSRKDTRSCCICIRGQCHVCRKSHAQDTNSYTRGAASFVNC